MTKYEPLIDFLKRTPHAEIQMTFEEIEKIIDRELPESANAYRAWWSNNPTNSVMTKAWLEAGWKSEQVDMEARKLVFRRVRDAGGSGNTPSPAATSLFGGLKGTVLILPGIELTEATGERWSADQGPQGE